MKLLKKVLLLSIVLLLVSTSSCTITDNKLDYSKVENWFKCDYSGSKEVDTFFVYPTLVMTGEGGTATIKECYDEIYTSNFYDYQPAVYAKDTNMYMPLYRQVIFSAVKGFTNKSFTEYLLKHQAYADVTNALDYYFENFNNNKPFILAGHSQGSALIYCILTDYMQKHPEYLTRMVACYAIGYGFSKSEIAKYSNLKFAEGEDDTNCIISFNTFGKDYVGPSILLAEDSYCINPLNWKTDGTYADISLNLGSHKGGKDLPAQSDAQVDVERGLLLSTVDSSYYANDAAEEFGTCSCHEYEYGFYYYNLMANVHTRIESYLSK